MRVLRKKTKSFEKTSYMIIRSFCFWERQDQKRDKNSNS